MLRDYIRHVTMNGAHSCNADDDVVVIGVIPEAGNPRRVCWTGVSERRQHHHSCEEQRRERTPTPHGRYNTPNPLTPLASAQLKRLSEGRSSIRALRRWLPNARCHAPPARGPHTKSSSCASLQSERAE